MSVRFNFKAFFKGYFGISRISKKEKGSKEFVLDCFNLHKVWYLFYLYLFA